MDASPGLQQFLFQQVKGKIPDNLSFVHEIAELLEISYDSAYRRIRGEKELSMEELYKLSHRFQISLDVLLGLQSNHVVFRKYSLSPGEFNIKDWLLRIQEDIKRIHSAKEKEIIYAAKDPPIFHYFHFPEIAAFKFFFWEKTIYDFPEYEDKQVIPIFAGIVFPDEIVKYATKKGLYVMAYREWEYMDILNFDEMKGNSK